MMTRRGPAEGLSAHGHVSRNRGLSPISPYILLSVIGLIPFFAPGFSSLPETQANGYTSPIGVSTTNPFLKPKSQTNSITGPYEESSGLCRKPESENNKYLSSG